VKEDELGLSLAKWHRRFTQQGEWTQNIRRYLFAKAHIEFNDKILEVGSGTGAILDLLDEEGYRQLFGIDILYHSLAFSRSSVESYHLAQADGYDLPFPDNSFSLLYSHYLLLWLENPAAMLTEMARVIRPGGYLLALAEPDHQARIDFPPPLDKLGRFQTEALAEQGVDIQLGRKLAKLFHQVGLVEVEAGILGAQWTAEMLHNVDQTEWLILRADLMERLANEQIEKYQDLEASARKHGSRVLFIPTFYAIGRVSKNSII